MRSPEEVTLNTQPTVTPEARPTSVRVRCFSSGLSEAHELHLEWFQEEKY